MLFDARRALRRRKGLEAGERLRRTSGGEELMKILLACVLFAAQLFPFAAAGGADKRGVGAQKAFFKNMKKLCARKFEGATDFPQDPSHPLAGKRLVMHVETCGEREIRIPFHVGEDRSRTWVLTLTSDGLLFKHDHRHADGTPDRVTNYGGLASRDGTAREQRFAADAFTADLIPEAKTNVWTMRIDEAKKRFTYYLERDAAPRYRAYFDLGKPL
jgi:hypothetical protein